jgi:hypothetical protein
MARAERYGEEFIHKAGVGELPPCEALFKRMRIIMVAANCGPAVASRCAKYDGGFLISTFLGAQPLSNTAHN